MTYVVISIILGLASWCIPIVNINKDNKKMRNTEKYIIVSFSFCLLAIYTQILLMKSYGEKWTLIVDAMDALDLVMPILIVATIILNIIFVRKQYKS